MIISLPDVNVWIALAAEGHVHHLPSREWFAAQSEASVAFCRFTHMGMLRLLTNASAMKGAPRTIEQAWEVSDRLRADRRVVFTPEPGGLELVWRELITQRDVGPSSWTDAYLAAFAIEHSCTLATFDLGFRRWTGLALSLLGRAA